MTAKKIRVAFVGAGPTTEAHIKAFSDLPTVSVVGIFNRTIEKAEKLVKIYGLDHLFPSLDALYKVGKPDLVVVCVYETAKREVMEKCLAYGVPIFAEKPIGLDYEESLKIADMAAKAECPVWVSLNRRTYSSTLEALKKLDKSPSKKRIIEVKDQQDLKIIVRLGHSPEVMKNWMYANSIHLVDYFSIFARGEIESINVLSGWDAKEPSFVAAHLKFTSQDQGLYTAYWNGAGPWSCHINNSDVCIALQPLETMRWQERGAHRWYEAELHRYDQDFKPGFRQQALEAIKAISGKSHKLCDINEALKSTKLIQAIYTPQ
ncbi:MAG: Gfo/Idh/MocA family oxidoreductase [Alphaproteobacteria bacterium]|nr:Gfo/Idh/MocA family oxidoreductase [Candidatus Parcubacteria bacterium]NCQ67544.1 Gfo/Idh/MocA family oxidoreductase [Alphaproteobacteria bacterium]